MSQIIKYERLYTAECYVPRQSTVSFSMVETNGVVYTPQGIVLVDLHVNKNSSMLYFEIVYGGAMYTQWLDFDRVVLKRWAVARAKQFAGEVAKL